MVTNTFEVYEWLGNIPGPFLGSLKVSKIKPVDITITAEDTYYFICSYSWACDQSKPTIYVPAAPPQFISQQLISQQLPFTCTPGESSLITPLWKPVNPFGVMFTATKVMNPDLRFDNIDVIISASTLHMLYGFCKLRPFGIFDNDLDLSMVRNTLLIDWKNRRSGTVDSPTGMTRKNAYAECFLQHFTRKPPSVQDSNGHFRVIQYNVGGLRCAVICELAAVQHDTGVDDLHNHKPLESCRRYIPQVIHRTGYMSPRVIAEVKLIEIGNMDQRGSHGLQWFTRTRCVVRGTFKSGGSKAPITKVTVDDDHDAIFDWERENQHYLRLLAGVLGTLREKTKNSPRKSCVAVSGKEPGTLCIFAAKPVLPLPILFGEFWDNP
ncbi:hypothetical protein FGRMN_4728 [Fusarium graminum]|nr:hypothetical protein FGRMN_4728 [Fusarium graminum]